MILSPMNVELTKVHYYESFRKHRNRFNVTHNQIRTIHNEINDNNINIKRNIFGQKSWTFNVTATNNDNFRESKYNKIKAHKLAMIVTSCIIVTLIASIAMATVIYLHKPNYKQIIPTSNTKDHSTIRIVTVFDQSELSNVETVLQRLRIRDKGIRDGKAEKTICRCRQEEVCLRQTNGLPECFKAKDMRDPSGCGGLCALNTQYCRLLEKKMEVYECVDNKNGLRCPYGYFNCGDALCVHATRVCDGNIDCPDLSDEKNCPCDLETHIRCGQETSCLAIWKRCNGMVDCWDSADEIDCPSRTKCPPGQLACINSTQCFQIAQFCDGNFDCSDKSDEICS